MVAVEIRVRSLEFMAAVSRNCNDEDEFHRENASSIDAAKKKGLSTKLAGRNYREIVTSYNLGPFGLIWAFR